MTVLFYWFSLRTFTSALAPPPRQCFGLHGVLLGTRRRGWLDLTGVVLSSGGASEGYNAGSFWLGRAQLGLAPARPPAFPSVQNFNERQPHEERRSSVKTMFQQMKIKRKKKNSLSKLNPEKPRRRSCNTQITALQLVKQRSIKPGELQRSSDHTHYADTHSSVKLRLQPGVDI